MSSKAELTRQFLEQVAREATEIGFTQKPKNVLWKHCGSEGILSIRYEFIGSGIVDAIAYAGVRLPSVEARLTSMMFFKGRPASTVRETVFQKIDAAIALITKDRIPSSVKLPDVEGVQVYNLKRYMVDLESAFYNNASIASYCVNDTSLPVGHHAFRIPFILKDAGMEDKCHSYMAGVRSKDFINGYDKFIEEFNELR